MRKISPFRALFAALGVVATFSTSLAGGTASAHVGPLVEVLVQESTEGNTAVRAVKNAGGEITFDLPIINGFAARVPAGAVASLQSSPGIAHISADRVVHMQSNPADDADTGTDTTASVFTEAINADKLNDQGVNGAGTTVALIDTGVSEVPDLQKRIVNVSNALGGTKRCVNLSGETGCSDTYGHGTFIAGLIAGDGSSSNGKYTGVAPESKILSIKIAGQDGSAPVGKILYAIQWVIDNRDRYGIDVLNLSLGTDSTNSYRHDPLNLAVEKAWTSGVTVVVSAGNRGPGNGTVSKPADDPLVITTGAVDDLGTARINDDILPDFSSRGPTVGDGLTKPDVTAPGGHVVSLRSPGSSIERQFPGGGIDSTYRRGSGTSMAAGVTSGAIALLKQAHPEWTPDQIKGALKSTAVSAASTDPNAVGAGLIDVRAASNLDQPRNPNQGVVTSDGTDPLAESQGSVGVVALAGNTTGGLLSGVGQLLSGTLNGVGNLSKGPNPADPAVAAGTPPNGKAVVGTEVLGMEEVGTAGLGTAAAGTEVLGMGVVGMAVLGTVPGVRG